MGTLVHFVSRIHSLFRKQHIPEANSQEPWLSPAVLRSLHQAFMLHVLSADGDGMFASVASALWCRHLDEMCCRNRAFFPLSVAFAN